MASIPTSAVRSLFGRAVGAVLAALLFLPVAHVAVAGEPVPAGPAESPAPAAVLTLEQALARAEERSPALIGAASGLEVADARLRQARSWGNPTLTVDAENVLGRGAYASFDSAETTVAISQSIPLGGGRAGQVRAAQSGLARAAAHQELARRELRRDLTVAYAEAVAADRQAAISRDRGRIALETRDAVERRFAAGLESELQRARARVEASGLQAASRRAAAESLARRRALAAHWREETVGEPLDAGWFDAADAAGSRSPSPQEGPADHPRLELARHRLDEARALLDAARGARFGGVEATVGTRRFSDAPSTDDRAWMLGLSVPLPLWDRNVETIARARADLLAAELEAEREAMLPAYRAYLKNHRTLVAKKRRIVGITVSSVRTRAWPARLLDRAVPVDSMLHSPAHSVRHSSIRRLATCSSGPKSIMSAT